jgi:uncharacterized protein (TIGR02001 family)
MRSSATCRDKPQRTRGNSVQSARCGAVLLAGFVAATPVRAADFGAVVAVASDEIYRGRSLSQGQPVASLDLSLDAASGFYGGASVTGVATRVDGTQLLGARQYAGYARRIAPDVTMDVGLTNAHYTDYYSGENAVDYAEAYVGLAGRNLSARIAYAPDYFEQGIGSLYGEANGAWRLDDAWRVSLHGGLLVLVGSALPPFAARTQFDWRVGIAWRVIGFDVQLAWSGAGPHADYYAGGYQGQSTLVLGVSHAF